MCSLACSLRNSLDKTRWREKGGAAFGETITSSDRGRSPISRTAIEFKFNEDYLRHGYRLPARDRLLSSEIGDV